MDLAQSGCLGLSYIAIGIVILLILKWLTRERRR